MDNDMEEQYVSFETACMLKEAGFDASCQNYYCIDDGLEYTQDFPENFNRYGDSYSRPTQSLAARWIREVHGLHVFCFQTNLPYTEPPAKSWEWGYEIDRIDDPNKDSPFDIGYSTYEQVFEEGLQSALEMIKERRNKQ